jgi:hypothetical protein
MLPVEREVGMPRTAKLALLLLLVLLLGTGIALSQAANSPTFSAKDRELIEAYYNHVSGTLAPGSLDRSEFPLAVEKALMAGSHVPMQLEKDLEPLPAKLESQLTQITGDYGRYTLGRHIVLIKKGDLTIADILKNVAVKERTR